MTYAPWLSIFLALVACGDKEGPSGAGSTSDGPVDADGDGYGDNVDCDDSSAVISPGAPELCDGLDNDCDGEIDEDPTDGEAAWVDADSDGYGDASQERTVCEPTDGLSFEAGDCDDDDAGVNPGAVEVCDDAGRDEDCDGLSNGEDDSLSQDGLPTWAPDADGDGYGDAEAAGVDACEDPSPEGEAWVANATDCDDTDDTVSPGATEVCDEANTDEDCDGLADDADDSVDLTGAPTWLPDADGDGFGDAFDAGVQACDDPSLSGDDWVLDNTDCDDNNASINPGAVEVCDVDNVDEDCSGAADDADADVDLTTASSWFPDVDTDTFGDATATAQLACDDPSGATTYVLDNTDCDDNNSAISPAATEVCDADDVDEDCDGLADDADPSVDASTTTRFTSDADGDGYGAATGGTTQSTCDPAPGYAETATDCDDSDSAVNPGATEVCDDDNTDEDCSGAADDADTGVDPTSLHDWTVDADGDGYGDDDATPTTQCDDPSTPGTTYVSNALDCDDSDSGVSPDATEVCDDDDTDEDCDGVADDNDSSVDLTSAPGWYVDDDEDGYGDELGTPVQACADPSGATTTYVDDNTDCDDTDADINPAATEIYGDGTDQTCDGDDVRTFSCSGYSVPGDYASISAASSALGNGTSVQTICLSARTYNESPTIRGNLEIIGPSADQTRISGHVTVISGRNGATVGLQGVTIGNGVEFDGGATSNEWTTTISDSVIEVTNQYGIFINRDGSGTPNVTVERSVIYGDSPEHAVYLYDYGSNTTDRVELTIRDSYLYDGVSGVRTTATSSRSTKQRITLVGNTIEGASQGVWIIGKGSSRTIVTMRNNILINNSTGFRWNGGGAVTYDHNLYYGNNTNFADSATSGTGDVFADPGLDSDVPPAPSSTGAAAGAGTTSSASSTDYWFNSRASPPSIGAVEPF